ncbi:hypothetical protein H4R34_001895 [Dimargaris verticillata]|uniref:NADP-dependent oxidoreductase domain-containing protein n=1 Tax=Dimargaris verticillata TaxID=2761393 RepID=A0A9W8B913_9FUNG|nr:hypothetical protein H4R34_001895 [Dimargaris verticillata]
MAPDCYTLKNGVAIPKIGVGTYRIKDEDLVDTVITTAIRQGYRLIDTATVYKNESAIGKALRSVFNDYSTYGVTRSDLFVVSKLAPRDQGFNACYNAVLCSLDKLGLEYIDLYLIHWPGTQKVPHDSDKNRANRQGSWQALEKLQTEGKLRSIGVSNYTVQHLSELLSFANLVPSVLQVEFHPLHYQPELVSYCQTHGIQLQAYSSLGQGELLDGSVPIPTLDRIAQRHRCSVPVVLLRWGLQHNAVVIPKSTQPARIKENMTCINIELSSAVTGAGLLGQSQVWDSGGPRSPPVDRQ